MISFDTTRFGRLEVSREKIIHFPEGLIGFPDVKRYILLDYKDTLLKWMQAVDNPDVAFIVAPPVEFFPDFSPKIEKPVRDFLNAAKEDDIIILAILRVENDSVTVNLQGPLVINSMNKKGVQVVNEDSQFSCRTPLASLSPTVSK